MSTSNTHQQSLADADSETRPPMFEREEDLKGDDLKHYEAEIKAMNLILISIPNDIYNYVDACTTTQAMWQRVERLMRGTVQNKVDRETRFNNEFDQFVVESGEALVSILNGSRVFDIVIGMDWIDKYNTNIFCSQKLVRVINSQGREVIIYGDRMKGDFMLCSVMKVRRYFSYGCHAFMAHVINTSFEKKSVEDVPIVNEFLDVFPEELLGIPPERKVEFRIDLIPSATPIAKTSYRLAPSEMKELMGQL
ncbi:hypothetical protein Tco_0576364 [Tanacetum coccineum]